MHKLTMIEFYNQIAKIVPSLIESNDEMKTTENFLSGIHYFYQNIYFLYSFYEKLIDLFPNSEIIIKESFYYVPPPLDDPVYQLRALYFQLLNSELDKQEICSLLNTISPVQNKYGLRNIFVKYEMNTFILTLEK